MITLKKNLEYRKLNKSNKKLYNNTIYITTTYAIHERQAPRKFAETKYEKPIAHDGLSLHTPN